MLSRTFRCDICRESTTFEENIQDIEDIDITQIPEGWTHLHETDVCETCKRMIADEVDLNERTKKPKKPK